MNKVEKMPAGYKVTEIGVIPEDWEVHEIEDVADVLSGKRIPKGRTLTENITPYPYITVSDMGAGSVNLENIRFVPEDVYPLIKKYRIFVDDIYISVAGTLGLIGTIPKQLNGANLTENADRLVNIKCDKNYLLYILSSSLIQKRIDEVKTLGAQPKLALTRIRKFCVAIPKTKSEQTAIATVLSDTDALIEYLEKLIAKKKAIKQGAMQQLLIGKKRLPGFNGEWEVKTLGEIGKFKGGSGFPIKYQGKVERKYPFYKVSDMNNDGNQTFMRNSNNWIDESTKKIIGSNIFPKHTIVFAKIGAAIYLERKKILFMESCIDNNMMGFIFDESQSDYRFLHYLFLSIQLGKLVSATALPSLNGKQISGLNFAFPRKKEQIAIAAILSDMDAEIEKLEQKLDKYRQIKSGMMQQLLTGKIRLGKN